MKRKILTNSHVNNIPVRRIAKWIFTVKVCIFIDQKSYSLDVPVVNKKFDTCRSRSQEEAAMLIQNKQLCDSVNGTWQTSYYWCPQNLFPEKDPDSTVVFIRDRGCLTSQHICNEANGVWTVQEIPEHSVFCLVDGIKKIFVTVIY